MGDIQELYSMIMGRDASQFQNDPEIRHISFYLCELLFKDYNEISAEAVNCQSNPPISRQKELYAEDQSARATLHKLVDQSTQSALKNIRAISNSVDHIGGIAKPALEIQKLSQKCDNYATGLLEQSGSILHDLDVYDSLKTDSDFLNTVAELSDAILKNSGGEKVSLLIAYEELLNDVAKVKESKVASVLKNNVTAMKRKIENDLFKSFNNNINVTLKVVADIRLLGLSSDDEIATGFVKNRNQHLVTCFEMIQTLAKENIHRGIHEATLALKTKVYSILLAYKTIFGAVDANLTCLMTKTIFRFLIFLKDALSNTNESQLNQKHRTEIEQEMKQISQSFRAFGFEFNPLLAEVFTPVQQDVR